MFHQRRQMRCVLGLRCACAASVASAANCSVFALKRGQTPGDLRGNRRENAVNFRFTGRVPVRGEVAERLKAAAC